VLVVKRGSLILKEEKRLRVVENRVLRRILGREGEGITGGWRKLYNEEVHNLYSSPNIRVIKSRIMRWAGHTERTHAGDEKCTQHLTGKPEMKRPLGGDKC
jgi:hypothetical protein